MQRDGRNIRKGNHLCLKMRRRIRRMVFITQTIITAFGILAAISGLGAVGGIESGGVGLGEGTGHICLCILIMAASAAACKLLDIKTAHLR